MAKIAFQEPEAVEILKDVPANEVPNSLEEAATLLYQMAQLEREVDSLNAGAEHQIAAIIRKHSPGVQRREKEMHHLARRVYAFARANREALTKNDKTKTIEIDAAGTVLWRFNPDSLEVTDEAAAIANIKQRGMQEELLSEETVWNLEKDKLKKDPETTATIPGIKICSGQEVFRLETADPLKGLKQRAAKAVKKEEAAANGNSTKKSRKSTAVAIAEATAAPVEIPSKKLAREKPR